MRRISTPSAVQDLFGPGKRGFTDGDPVGGIPATFLSADWFNQVQEEITRVIEGAGIALNGDVQTQLLEAIGSIVHRSAHADLPVLAWQAEVPANPVRGDRYVVGAGAVGAWLFQDHKIAFYGGAGWHFAVPAVGQIANYVRDGRINLIYFTGVHWQPVDFARITPTRTLTFYVRVDGNDVNDGSANTAGKAFRTIGAAVDFAASRYLGANVIALINVGAGVFPAVFVRSAGSMSFQIVGSGRASTSIEGGASEDTFTAQSSFVNLSSCTVLAGRFGIASFDRANINLNDVAIRGREAPLSEVLLSVGEMSRLAFGGNVRLSGRARRALDVATNGLLTFGGQELAFDANPVFDTVARASLGGVISRAGGYIVGSPSGKRYDAVTGGVIDVEGGGANFFPGTVAGTTTSGGIYA